MKYLILTLITLSTLACSSKPHVGGYLVPDLCEDGTYNCVEIKLTKENN